MRLLSGVALPRLLPDQPDGTLVGMEKVVVRAACGNRVRLWQCHCLPSNRPDGTLAGMERVVMRDACGNRVRLLGLFVI